MTDNNPCCLGTRMVVLMSEDLNHPKEGLLAVSSTTTTMTQIMKDKNHNNDIDSSVLRLRLATNAGCYEGSISLDSIKVSTTINNKQEEKSKREIITEYLLNNNNNNKASSTTEQEQSVAVLFQFLNDNDLQMTIQQRIVPSGLMKYIYRGVLTNESSTTTTNAKDILSFTAFLGDSINHFQTRISNLTSDLNQANTEIENWKRTTQQLDTSIWKQEKNEFLKAMTALWKEHQRRTKVRISQLEQQLAEARKQTTTATTTTTTTNAQTFSTTSMIMPYHDPDAPDDVDLVPDEMARTLAAGKKILTAATDPTREQRMKPGTTTIVTSSKRRKKESQDQKQDQKYSKTKRPKFNSTASSSKKKSPPLPPSSSSSKASKASTSSTQKDDDNYSDSEDEAFRKKIFASVRKNRVDNNDDNDDDDTDLSF